MQSCLGIYIEENIIKYAKLHKEKENIKIESYNIAFYENNLEETIKKIISETYSYKVPISINVSDELYNTFSISALLNKQDTKKAVKIEYEMLCEEKGYNKASLEHKYIISSLKENPEVQKVLSVIANKNEISKRTMVFEGNKINTITPVTTSITNLLDNKERENVAIVNIEEKTKITVIVDGQIYQIDVLDEGMGKILETINRSENSYAKSYEVCKNMTIYTDNSSELYTQINNEYMDIATSVLLKIVTQTKQIISEMFSSIDKVYITGSGTAINNVDLFFQEYIPAAKCEILKPFFLNAASLQLPIKEYIEVNSAIALALDGLGMVEKDLNFSKSAKTGSGKTSLKSALNQEISLATIGDLFSNLGSNIKQDFSTPFTSTEKLLARGVVACLMISVVFSIFSIVIDKQINKKSEEVQIALSGTTGELGKLTSDINTISSRTTTYQELITEITAPPEETEQTPTNQRIIQKDSIPNLLNRIMFVIPKKVKLISIQNTTSNHIVIQAEAEKYEQLGYFKAVLTTNGILQNVKSNSGQKTGTAIQVTIEGDLP